MSRIERSRKTLLAHCFRSFGKNDFKDTSVRNVWEKKQIQQGLHAVAK